MNKIKILQVNKLYYPYIGGIERVVRQLAEGLNDRVDMKICCCQEKGPHVIEYINGVEVHKAASLGLILSLPVAPGFFSQFRTLSKDRDILHIHTPFPLADIALKLFGFRGKVVLWWHSDIIRQKRYSWIYRPFLLATLRRADAIVVATQGHINSSEYLPLFEDKCVIIPYGVNEKLLQHSERVCFKTSNSKTIFLFVGRMVYYKGLDVLLNAFARLPDAQLVMVGDGPCLADLQTQAKELRLEDRVNFAGNVDDEALSHAFASCDVFVLPSVAKSEAFGLVQIEAMAYGKPVINTNLPGGVPFVSLDGVTGITVPPRDEEALAEAMQRLAMDPVLREKYGKAGYERARKEFSVKTMCDRVKRLYDKLVARE